MLRLKQAKNMVKLMGGKDKAAFVISMPRYNDKGYLVPEKEQEPKMQVLDPSEKVSLKVRLHISNLNVEIFHEAV